MLRQISTQKGMRVELMETKADMDGTMVELFGGIETIRTLDSAQTVFSVLVIGISVLLASRKVISVGTVLTAYLCFTQLTGPLRELHRILDEFSECMVLARDYFRILDLPIDFSYQIPDGQAPSGPGQTQHDTAPVSGDVQIQHSR